MKSTAKLSYLNIAPRKVRMIADLIRGKSVESAQLILSVTVKRGVAPLVKLLYSAVANAKNNYQLEIADLYIAKLTVDEGPKRKRWKARSRGSAGRIEKKTSHITLYLDEITGKGAKRKKSDKKSLQKEQMAHTGEKAQNKEKGEETIISNKPRFEKKREINRPKTEKESSKKVFRRKAF